MRIQVLRQGDKGREVLALEEFLRDDGHYWVEADGFFDEETHKSVVLYQRSKKLKGDGIVGTRTWGALLQDGFNILESGLEVGSSDKRSPNWPSIPKNLRPMTAAEKEDNFGRIEFEPAPSKGSPESIRITNDWTKNLTEVEVPQMATVPGVFYKGVRVGAGPKKVHVHKEVAESFTDLWAAWEKARKMSYILTWGGLWAPRFIRGSRTTLSNHAYAAAFDINAGWNGLRRIPALVGHRGCVRKLVEVANEHGWYWGGHFTRQDGMHFEYGAPK